MLIFLKLAMLRQGIRQTQMAVALGWDPAKLSRIVNEVIVPTDAERAKIAQHLGTTEAERFRRDTRQNGDKSSSSLTHVQASSQSGDEMANETEIVSVRRHSLQHNRLLSKTVNPAGRNLDT